MRSSSPSANVSQISRASAITGFTDELFSFTFVSRYEKAVSSISTAVTFAPEILSSATAIAPLPEQRSTVFLSVLFSRKSTQRLTTTSVSSRGMSTPLPTLKSNPIKLHSPRIYCNGSPEIRFSINFKKLCEQFSSALSVLCMIKPTLSSEKAFCKRLCASNFEFSILLFSSSLSPL